MTAVLDEAGPPPERAWERAPVAAPLRADSPLRRFVSEPILLAAGGQRALLLQLAHPKVATGVEDHSRFRSMPVRRLFGTADKVLTLVYGSGGEPQAAWESIMEVHDRINGELHHDAGGHAAGDLYTAHDPELLLWVWASLVETLEVVTERYVAPFRPGERAALYADWVTFATFFGVPDDLVPPDREAFGEYWDAMLGGGELGVSATGVDVTKAILSPPLPYVPGFVKTSMATVAVGLLPERVRAMYGFDWGTRRRRDFDRLDALMRAVYPRLPSLRRAAPYTWMAAKRAVSPRWRKLARA